MIEGNFPFSVNYREVYVVGKETKRDAGTGVCCNSNFSFSKSKVTDTFINNKKGRIFFLIFSCFSTDHIKSYTALIEEWSQ